MTNAWPACIERCLTAARPSATNRVAHAVCRRSYIRPRPPAPISLAEVVHASLPIDCLRLVASLAVSFAARTSRRIQAWPRFRAARRSAERDRHASRMEEQDLPRHDPRLLGLCSAAIRRGPSGLRHGVSGRPCLRQRAWRLPSADRVRQSDSQEGNAGRRSASSSTRAMRGDTRARQTAGRPTIAASNTTRSAINTPSSCWKRSCPRWARNTS